MRGTPNGVVRTLGHSGQHLQNLGHEVLLITPEKFLTYPCPTYPSDSARGLSEKGCPSNAAQISTSGRSYRHGGPSWARGKSSLSRPIMALHHVVSHTVSRIYSRQISHPDQVVCLLAPIPQSCRPHHVRDTAHAAIVGSTRFQEVGDLGERRRYRHLSTWSQVIFFRTATHLHVYGTGRS